MSSAATGPISPQQGDSQQPSARASRHPRQLARIMELPRDSEIAIQTQDTRSKVECLASLAPPAAVWLADGFGPYRRAFNSRWNFQPGMKKVRALTIPKIVIPIWGKRAMGIAQRNMTMAWM